MLCTALLLANGVLQAMDVAQSPSEQLKRAIRINDINELNRLIQSGVDVNSKDNDGYTALTNAVIQKNLGICELLIRHGAQVNEKNNDGETPLMLAASDGNLDICKLLIASGADANLRDNGGHTAIISAVSWNLYHPTPERDLILYRLLISTMIQLTEIQKKEIAAMILGMKKGTDKNIVNKDAQQLAARIKADDFRRKNAQFVTDQLDLMKSARAQQLIQTLKTILNDELNRRKGF